MADNRRGREKRLYFNRAQLLVLAAGIIVASVVIFFLGMFIGKEIEGRKLVKNEEPLVRIPVKPLLQSSASGEAASSKEELTFYDTLTKKPEAKSTRRESVKEGKQPEKVAKAEVKGTKPEAKEGTTVPAKKAQEPESEKAASVAESRKESPDVRRAETTRAESESSAGEKMWSVQVNAFPDERSARIWVERLKNKGYNAYAVEAAVKGRNWYRVRVGRYGTREEAEKIEEQLKTRENLTKAFATSQ